MSADTVLRWWDGSDHVIPLEDQLRARPNQWAIVAEDVHEYRVGDRRVEVRRQLGDGFEVDTAPCDDGEYGVLYEIRARYAPDPDD